MKRMSCRSESHAPAQCDQVMAISSWRGVLPHGKEGPLLQMATVEQLESWPSVLYLPRK
jgi:hypothetical protein